ncbi:MAG: dTMP kinase [Clostridiales bacterium]|nr:dTMP kinase [Clostridiales bacterium]
MNKGKFIVFEGIDGSGKSTQIKLLSQYLKEKNVPFYITREPTDSPFGALAHQCMTGRIDTDDKTIASVCVADRIDHIFNKTNGLLEKINNGVTVISDRYYFSNYAYQGVYMPLEWLIEANKFSAEALKPDVNIYIDVEAKVSAKRLQSRGDKERYEEENTMFHIREKYFEAFDRLKDAENVRVVQSQKEPMQTQMLIREVIDELFKF